ncbi:MAG TPA: PilZ domain-containing protein [Polyangia bacterium]|nr:PilZ domain-containing protein [Polyangia bacterium]
MASSSASSSLKGRISLQDPVDPAERLEGTPIVVASFSSGREFLEHYTDDGPAGELALVTRARPRARAELVIEVSWPGLPNPVFVRAHVSRRRLGVIARLHEDETAARDFLVRMAHGDALHVHLRRHRRYCVRLPLSWRIFGSMTMIDGIAADLSAGGLLVTTRAAAPPVGEHVAVRLRTPQQDLVVTGEVRHSRPRKHDSAFGVQFLYRSTGEQRRLRGLLRAFAARGVVILERD